MSALMIALSIVLAADLLILSLINASSCSGQ
nr:MAG TPA: hypothetical protein [Caudoviricetes sp.]